MARERHHSLDAEQVLQELMAGETAEREVKSPAYQMKAACHPAHRDLAGIDFTQARVDETLVRQLHRGDFMGSAQNVVLIGGSGMGKPHLATDIGVEAIQRHQRRALSFYRRTGQRPRAGKSGRQTGADSICLPARRAVPCCFTCSSNSTSAPAS